MTIARAAALAALAAALAGFVRTTDRESKVCLYWPDRNVHWTVNATRPFTSPSCGGDGALGAVRDSFAAWPAATASGAAAPCTDLKLVEDGTATATSVGYDRGGTNENLVVFREGWCSAHVPATDACWADHACGNRYGCFQDDTETDRHVIAVTTVTYDVGSGRIFDADIEVADWDGQGTDLTTPASNGWYFTCDDSVPQCSRYGDDRCNFIDLRNALTHEVGHFIGLAHVPRTSANRASTMYPDTGPGDRAKRDLSADDVAGVCTIYPAGAPSPTCGGPSSGGCGAPAAPRGAALGDGLLLAGAIAVVAIGRWRKRLTTR